MRLNGRTANGAPLPYEGRGMTVGERVTGDESLPGGGRSAADSSCAGHHGRSLGPYTTKHHRRFGVSIVIVAVVSIVPFAVVTVWTTRNANVSAEVIAQDGLVATSTTADTDSALAPGNHQKDEDAPNGENSTRITANRNPASIPEIHQQDENLLLQNSTTAHKDSVLTPEIRRQDENLPPQRDTSTKENSTTTTKDLASAPEIHQQEENSLRQSDSSKDENLPPKSQNNCPDYKQRSDHDVREMNRLVRSIDFGADVERFVFFLGFPRSGHSWIGAVLDASPNALVANEYNAIQKFKKAFSNNDTFTRNFLFEELAKNSFLCGKYGRWQVYDYSIPGLWQGKIADGQKLVVIGDKRGGATTRMLKAFGRSWSGDEKAASRLRTFMTEFYDVVKASPRVVVVLRNPFNMISTVTLRHCEKKHVKNGANCTVSRHRRTLEQIEFVLWAAENLFDVEQVHILTMESFAANTEDELVKLCEFLGISCPPIMIEKVVNQTHHTPHDTFHMLEWKPEHVQEVNEFILTYLSEYGYKPINGKD